MTALSLRPFWQPCWSARSVVVVEVNGYTIEPGADLEGANLEAVWNGHGVWPVSNRGAFLREADLRGANLSWANLSGANFAEANLSGANLTSVRLPFDGSGASDQYLLTHDCDDEFIITNLSGAVFKQPREWRNWLEDSPGANLTGVTADETTVWPEGFDPKAFGVICG